MKNITARDIFWAIVILLSIYLYCYLTRYFIGTCHFVSLDKITCEQIKEGRK